MDSLNRRSIKASFKAKLYFMHDYFGEHKLSANNRKKINMLDGLAKKRLLRAGTDHD
jgi:hypothetical protein